MSSYVILIKYTHEGAQLDSCLDVSYITQGGDVKALLTAEQVAVRMGQPRDPKLDSLAHSLRVIEMRTRFDSACDGPYLIHTPHELSRGEIDLLLQDKDLLTRIRKRRISL